MMPDLSPPDPPDDDLGNRLRALRTARGRTVAAVAYQAKVTKGFLSQLERGRTRASLATLRRIAGTLGVPLADLLAEPTEPEPPRVAPRLSRHDPFGPDRLLTPDGLFGLEGVESAVAAGAASRGVLVDPVPTSHLLLVREGRLTVHIDDIPHRLGPGDSLAFASPPGYAWRNEGPQRARLVWVLAPPRRG